MTPLPREREQSIQVGKVQPLLQWHLLESSEPRERSTEWNLDVIPVVDPSSE